jgi:peptide subunit release factor 1 (eRF1)
MTGVEGEMLTSEEKATFIEQQLPAALESHRVDTLNVNQDNDDARLAANHHISETLPKHSGCSREPSRRNGCLDTKNAYSL